MKVKNIAFSGFAAAILMGACGAADAATYQLASKDYVDTEVAKKQNELSAGNGINIVGDTVSVDTSVVATKNDITGFVTAQDVYDAIDADLSAESDGAIAAAISAAVSGVENTANTAAQNAASAVQTAGAASQSASTALANANSALEAAGLAQATAEGAVTTAGQAKAVAEGAQSVASAAQTVAGEAKSAATAAQTAATNAQNAVASKQDALTAGDYISITKDETTGETVIDSTYRYDDTEIKADIQANADAIQDNADAIALKASTATVNALAGRVSANETALQGKAATSDVNAISNKIGTVDMGTEATTITGAIAELKTITEGLPNDANLELLQKDIDAVETEVAKKANATTVSALSGRVDTLQTNSLSKESMGLGSFLVTNNGSEITYTAIEVVAGDGETNMLTGEALSK